MMKMGSLGRGFAKTPWANVIASATVPTIVRSFARKLKLDDSSPSEAIADTADPTTQARKPRATMAAPSSAQA
jgi:hypothetical protein